MLPCFALLPFFALALVLSSCIAADSPATSCRLHGPLQGLPGLDPFRSVLMKNDWLKKRVKMMELSVALVLMFCLNFGDCSLWIDSVGRGRSCIFLWKRRKRKKDWYLFILQSNLSCTKLDRSVTAEGGLGGWKARRREVMRLAGRRRVRRWESEIFGFCGISSSLLTLSQKRIEYNHSTCSREVLSRFLILANFLVLIFDSRPLFLCFSVAYIKLLSSEQLFGYFVFLLSVFGDVNSLQAACVSGAQHSLVFICSELNLSLLVMDKKKNKEPMDSQMNDEEGKDKESSKGSKLGNERCSGGRNYVDTFALVCVSAYTRNMAFFGRSLVLSRSLCFCWKMET